MSEIFNEDMQFMGFAIRWAAGKNIPIQNSASSAAAITAAPEMFLGDLTKISGKTPKALKLLGSLWSLRQQGEETNLYVKLPVIFPSYPVKNSSGKIIGTYCDLDTGWSLFREEHCTEMAFATVDRSQVLAQVLKVNQGIVGYKFVTMIDEVTPETRHYPEKLK